VKPFSRSRRQLTTVVFLDFSDKAATNWHEQVEMKGRLYSEEALHRRNGFSAPSPDFDGVFVFDWNFLGEAVDFEKATGVLYIPDEEKNMKLKVEALGSETIVDVAKLLEHKDKGDM